MLNLRKIFRQDTIVFIDDSNLFFGARKLGVRLDYIK